MDDNNSPAQAIIVKGTLVEGRISGNVDVCVEGVVKGEINIGSKLTVAKDGRTDASINAATVVIDGKQFGDINAKESIQISPGGVVKGNLAAPQISLEKGAKFSGNVSMTIDEA